MNNALSRSVALLGLLFAAACGSKTTYQALPISSGSSATDDGEKVTQTVDGTLCDRFATCAPHLFAAEYPHGHDDCFVNLYGSGRGVHVLASSADACTADLNASCAFVGDADGGADAGRFATLVLPTSCLSN